MKIYPLHSEIDDYLDQHNLKRKFEKQIRLFRQNPFHASLKTELMELRKMRIWSFRIDQKYRVIFIFLAKDTIEIIDVNNHYQ